MRRTLAMATALALLSIPAPTAAQTTWGLLAGFNRATFIGGDAVDVDAKAAFLVGGMAVMEIREQFSIRPELYFSTKGAKVRTPLGGLGDATFKLSYIQLPVLAQLDVAPEGTVRPYLFGGPSFAVRLSCTLGGLACDDLDDLPVRSVDVGMLAGAELEVGDAAVGVRYEVGLTSIVDSQPATDIENGVLSVTVRYLIRR